MRKTATLFLILILCTTVLPAKAVETEAAQALSVYGIMQGDPDGNFRLSDSISRAEFAKMIIAAKDGTVFAPRETLFSDVAASHWASGYIAAATEYGIINGMGDGTFSPSAPVTHSQAMKMVLETLGYGTKALVAGGYPTGYFAVSKELNFMVSFPQDEEEASRGEIACLIAEALDVPLYAEKRTYYFDENGRLSFRAEQTQTNGQTATLRTALDSDR